MYHLSFFCAYRKHTGTFRIRINRIDHTTQMHILSKRQFTGSQESILQLDMDTEDGGEENNDENIRARSVSPSLMVQLDHEVRFAKQNTILSY